MDAVSFSLHKSTTNLKPTPHVASAIAWGSWEATGAPRLGCGTREDDASLVLEMPPAAVLVFYIVCNTVSVRQSTVATVICVTKPDCIVCLSELFSQFYAFTV